MPQSLPGAVGSAGTILNRLISAPKTIQRQPYQDADGNWHYPSAPQDRLIEGGGAGPNTAIFNPETEINLGDHVDAPNGVGPDGKPLAGGGAKTFGDYSPEQIAEASALANRNRWSQQGEYDKSLAAETDALQYLKGKLEGIQNPSLGDKYKDIVNQANLSQGAQDAQGFAMGKLKGLTDVQETAEERLMREVARRKQENQMAAQRKATAQNLAARGVYGSGAELASMLGAQNTTNQSRALEEMEAQANAQKRALAALQQYTDAGFKTGAQDLAFGQEANKTNSFNSQMKQQDNQWRVGAQRELNNDAAKRAATIADTARDRARTIERNANNRTNTILTTTGLQNQTATSGAQLENGAASNLASQYKEDAARADANPSYVNLSPW